MNHMVEGPAGMRVDATSMPGEARVTFAVDVPPGGRLRVLKFFVLCGRPHRTY
jgi:hypothetical protein